MSDSQKISTFDGNTPDPLDDPRLTALALGEPSSALDAELAALDDEARREVDEIARFADSLGAALRSDEAGLDAGRRAAILAASMAASKRAVVLPIPAARGRVLRRVVQWSAGGAVAAGLALTIAPPILEARKHGNEAAAIGALKTVNSAETLFREGDKEQNGTLDYGSIAQISNTTLIDGVLGSTKRQGYTFDVKPGATSGDFLWFAVGNPGAPTSTGDRYFCSNHSGVVYYTREELERARREWTANRSVDTEPFAEAKPDEVTKFEYFDTAVLRPGNERLEQILNQEHVSGRLTREELDRLRERAVADPNSKQREVDDLRREKNDLQENNVELARRFEVEKQRLAKEKGDLVEERARLERAFALEQARILGQDASLQSRIDELAGRRYRAKVVTPGSGPLPGLGAPGPGSLPSFVRLNALTGPTAAPAGDRAEYELTLEDGRTTNGLNESGFFAFGKVHGNRHGGVAPVDGFDIWSSGPNGVEAPDHVRSWGPGGVLSFGEYTVMSEEHGGISPRGQERVRGGGKGGGHQLPDDDPILHARAREVFIDPFVPLDPAVEKAHVETLLKRSVDQLSVRRFDGAEQTLEEILARDPTNEEALKLRQISRESRHLVEGRGDEQLAQGPNQGDLEVPYFPYGRVEFPDKEHWMRIRERNTAIADQPADVAERWKQLRERYAAVRARDVGIAQSETRMAEWVRDYAQVLRSRKVNLNFAETPLGEVVSFLQDITGLNITVAPEVDQEKTLVSLRAKDLPLEEALGRVLQQTNLGMDLMSESLLLGPGRSKGLAETLLKSGGKITNYELSSGGVGVARIEIDGVWYDLPTSKPTPTASTTIEGLYTDGWRPTPLIETAKERQSTFAIDVDTASYARVRSSIRTQNRWPAASTVRVEELVNYHAYDYAPPTDGRPLAASSEVTTCPWAPDRRLVRIGLRGRGLEGQARPAANLVFLIDVSGSMGSVEKLPLVQRALTLLVSQLGAQDKVSIVVYAGASGCVLDGVSGADKATILGALERLQSGGSTNGGAGIELAYELCSRRFIEGGVNRVILCTDGDWNVGTQSPPALEELIARKAKGNLSLTALGFGMSEGGDKTLETLADRGDGNYAYVDGIPEARRVLVEQLDGTLVTIGKDVKVQVEWDPAAVVGYTLVGYENRRLENKDFANDAKDAGDVGARHAVTALYEVKLAPGATNLGTLRLRWKAVKAGQADEASELLEVPLVDDGRTLENTSTDTRFAMGVAAFALGLKAGPGPGRQLLEVAQTLSDGARGADPHGLRADFSELVRTARQLGR